MASSSSSSSSSTSKRYYAPKGPIRSQQRYVPRSTNTNPVVDTPNGGGGKNSSNESTKSIPSLTTSLRASSSSKEKRAMGGNFVNYLPQDEAVASGLGADAGCVDATESQRVVDVLNEELSELLKMRPREFWREVARNDSLHGFIDSFLQFRHRWYDFPHRGVNGMVAGVIVGEAELSRRVFMVLYRMSSSRDPGASASDGLSIKEHTALLQEKKLLDLPKLLDICAIYGHENKELTKSLVSNAMRAQPNLQDNLSAVVSHFLDIVHTMHERCSSSLEVLSSSSGHEGHSHGKLYQDFLEVMDFINDAVVTLDAFADAFKPAALHFSLSFAVRHASEDLLSTLVKLHDSFLPSLRRGFTFLPKTNGASGNISSDELQNVVISLKMLSTRLVSLGWKLLDSCYLSDEPIEESLLQNATKMFPAKLEDPAIRGDVIVQTLKEIYGEALFHFQGSTSGGFFIQNLEKNYKILSRIDSLRTSGWIFMDDDQFQYISLIASLPPKKTLEKALDAPPSSHNDKAHVDEDAIIMESKISQIKDLFPDYGKGFLSACLDVYNHDPEEVIQRILEGTLHEDLLSLDTSLEQIPSSNSFSHNRKDKGKGLLVAESACQSSSVFLARKDPIVSGGDVKAPPPSTYGRFTRKSNENSKDSLILDSKSDKDAIRSTILAAELEYEDEYDDSFDDLGLSLVESGFEETENLSDNIASRRGKSWGPQSESSSQSSGSKWASQKKPQFYVKDGKNYSYKVSGSVAVSNAQEAAVVNQSQKETIHGLGRGGNIPHGAVKKMMDAEEQDDESAGGDSEGVGRGNDNSRGRGGGRRGGGGRNNYRKDRAMKKHFSGLGGF